MQDIGMNHDIKRLKDQFTNELVSKHFEESKDPNNIIHTKDNNLKAPGFEYQAELVAATMNEVKSGKYDAKYIKNFHQTGYTAAAAPSAVKELFLSQILGNVNSNTIEMAGLKSIGIKDVSSLSASQVLSTKNRPGRKAKDTGTSNKSKRTYSVTQVCLFVCFLFCFHFAYVFLSFVL